MRKGGFKVGMFNVIKERKQLECLLSWVLYFGKDGRVWAKDEARWEFIGFGPRLLPVGNFSGGQLAGLNRAGVAFEGLGGLSLSLSDHLARKVGALGELEGRSQPVAES